MSTSMLYIFSDTDAELPIATLAELRAALPALPIIPSLYRLDSSDCSISIAIIYGSPDQDHHTVAVYTFVCCATAAADIAKETFETVHKATEYFLAMAKQAI